MLQEPIIKDGPARRWEDFVVPQCWEDLTSEDHAVWDLLFARQVELLGTRVVSPFLDGIDLLRLSHPGIPDVEGLNAILTPRTGWRVVAVPGLVPDDIFFAMLAMRASSGSEDIGIGSMSVYRPTIDPLSLLAIAAVTAMVGVAAAFVPARRAARMHPLLALRHE